jgi:hypothetical protein
VIPFTKRLDGGEYDKMPLVLRVILELTSIEDAVVAPAVLIFVAVKLVEYKMGVLIVVVPDNVPVTFKVSDVAAVAFNVVTLQ